MPESCVYKLLMNWACHIDQLKQVWRSRISRIPSSPFSHRCVCHLWSFLSSRHTMRGWTGSLKTGACAPWTAAGAAAGAAAGIVLVVLVAQSIEAAAPQHRQSDTYQYDAMPCHAMACYAMISNETYESMDCSRTFPAHRTYATDPRISKTLSVQGGVGTLLFLVENRPRRAWSVSVLQWHTNWSLTASYKLQVWWTPRSQLIQLGVSSLWFCNKISIVLLLLPAASTRPSQGPLQAILPRTSTWEGHVWLQLDFNRDSCRTERASSTGALAKELECNGRMQWVCIGLSLFFRITGLDPSEPSWDWDAAKAWSGRQFHVAFKALTSYIPCLFCNLFCNAFHEYAPSTCAELLLM